MLKNNEKNGDDFKDSEKWKFFQKLTFSKFLYEIGMFQDDQNADDSNAFTKARDRYLHALRCDVKGSGLLILRRRPADILCNNYNKKLIKLHQANMDIQFM